MTTVKETQGHRKLKQYLEDLRRNKHFIAAIKKIEAALASAKETKRDEKQEAILNQLIEDQQVINEAVSKALDQNRTITNQILEHLAEEYGIDGDLFRSISVNEILGKEEFNLGELLPKCTTRNCENINPIRPIYYSKCRNTATQTKIIISRPREYWIFANVPSKSLKVLNQPKKDIF